MDDSFSGSFGEHLLGLARDPVQIGQHQYFYGAEMRPATARRQGPELLGPGAVGIVGVLNAGDAAQRDAGPLAVQAKYQVQQT